MKPLNKQLWGRALDRAVPETYTTLNGEQLARAIDQYSELIIRECISVADKCREDEWFDVSGAIAEHFGLEDL